MGAIRGTPNCAAEKTATRPSIRGPRALGGQNSRLAADPPSTAERVCASAGISTRTAASTAIYGRAPSYTKIGGSLNRVRRNARGANRAPCRAENALTTALNGKRTAIFGVVFGLAGAKALGAAAGIAGKMAKTIANTEQDGIGNNKEQILKRH